MMKTMTKKMNNKKGFTLIELIVVIAILGILAAIAIPRLSGFQDKAKVSADKATLASIHSAIALGVANGDIKDGEVLVKGDGSTGAITFTLPASSTSGYKVLETGAAFKLKDNLSADLKWVIDKGEIKTAPSIDGNGKIS